MRARDVRAIGFFIVSTLILLAGSFFLLRSILVSLAMTGAYDAWLLTRPRAIRVFRRLRGEPDWSGYFDNEGTRLSVRPAPGAAPPSPRPAERP
jgi:hypothetical protein